VPQKKIDQYGAAIIGFKDNKSKVIFSWKINQYLID
jgi:hypothetical protein